MKQKLSIMIFKNGIMMVRFTNEDKKSISNLKSPFSSVAYSSVLQNPGAGVSGVVIHSGTGPRLGSVLRVPTSSSGSTFASGLGWHSLTLN